MHFWGNQEVHPDHNLGTFDYLHTLEAIPGRQTSKWSLWDVHSFIFLLFLGGGLKIF